MYINELGFVLNITEIPLTGTLTNNQSYSITFTNTLLLHKTIIFNIFIHDWSSDQWSVTGLILGFTGTGLITGFTVTGLITGFTVTGLITGCTTS